MPANTKHHKYNIYQTKISFLKNCKKSKFTVSLQCPFEFVNKFLRQPTRRWHFMFAIFVTLVFAVRALVTRAKNYLLVAKVARAQHFVQFCKPMSNNVSHASRHRWRPRRFWRYLKTWNCKQTTTIKNLRSKKQTTIYNNKKNRKQSYQFLCYCYHHFPHSSKEEI